MAGNSHLAIVQWFKRLHPGRGVVTCTWNNFMHGMGAIRGWMEITQTNKKWLRFHAYQEWYVLWGNRQAQNALLLFFDYYLKHKNNDWEATPRVRMAVLRYETTPPLKDLIEHEIAIPRTTYKKAYLSHGQKLSVDNCVLPIISGVAVLHPELP
jgi:predicted acyl esterase